MTFSHGYALLVGVDTYRHVPQLNIPITLQDIAAVAGILSNPKYCGYPSNQVRTLSGAAATRANILDALYQIARQTGPEDTVFLFHSGHGGYGTDGSFHLICHDTQIEGNKVAIGTGIHQGELLAKFKAIPAQRLLLIFDTCHSGELSPTRGNDQAFDGKNIPEMTAEALLYTGSGRSIITACREKQLSWIGRGKISIFPQALVDSLQGKGISPRGGYISLFDLYTALYEAVRRAVEAQYGRRQEPELTLLKGVGPFAVALYQGAAETDPGAAETVVELPQGPAVRQVEPERSRQSYQQIISQTGGINFGQGNQVEIKGDATGGDRIDARNTDGFIQHASGPVEQKFDKRVNTGGGAFIGGSVNVQGGDFVGRDKITHAPSSQELTVEDFFALLEQLRAELRNTQLEGIVSARVESEIAGIEDEARDDDPRLRNIEAKLTRIQSLVQKTAGVVSATTGLAQIVERAIALAQALFR